MRTLRIALLFVVVLLALAACGGGGASNQAPANPTATPPSSSQARSTATPTPTQEAAGPTAAPAEDNLNLDTLTGDLAALSSYKSTFTMNFVGQDEQGQAVTATWTMQEDLIRQPWAQRVAMTSSDSAEGQAGTFEVITIGDMSYMVTQAEDGEPSCLSTSSSETDPSEQAWFTPDMMGGISDAKYLGTETVNGVRTKHYAWKESSLPVFGFSSVQGDAWMAADGEYVVKYVSQATGKGTLFGSTQQEGTITLEYNLTDVNGSFTIEAPAGCETPATDIPLMPNARDVSSFGTTVTYSSASTLAEVVEFYQTEMPKNGWQASSEPMMADTFATLEFTQEGRTAQLVLSYDADAQTTSVVITTIAE